MFGSNYYYGTTSTAALYAGSGAYSYAVNGFDPATVADFSGVGGAEYYRVGGVESDFDTMFTYTGASNKTMTDSDGNLKWAPHNLALNSASPATQSITVVSGADYTVEITGTGSITLSNAGTGSVTAGNPVEITASTTTLTLTVVGSPTTMWCYRSDLGGMVNNPDTGTSYVATSGSAVYLPRRNSYRYNGSSYVNKGITLESTAATNLVAYGMDIGNSSGWQTSSLNATVSTPSLTAPDGTTNGARRITEDSSSSTFHRMQTNSISVTNTAEYVVSCFMRAGTRQYGCIRVSHPTSESAIFDLSGGTVTDETGVVTSGMDDVGGGWYRCWLNFSADSTLLSGVSLALSDSGIPTYTSALPSYNGDGSSYIDFYGLQVEAGTLPSTLIPTSGATATRAAETLTIAGANMAASTSAMSFQMQGEFNYADNATAVAADGATGEVIPYRWYTDASNYINVGLDTSTGGTGGWVWQQEDAGTHDSVSGTTSELSPGVNVAFNIAARHTSSALNGASAGTAATENSTPTTLDDLSAVAFDVGEKVTGTVALLRQWDVDIGDTGIAEATS